MTVKENVTITLVLLVFMLSAMLVSFGCEKNGCKKGEVKVNGVCYAPGVSYTLDALGVRHT